MRVPSSAATSMHMPPISCRPRWMMWCVADLSATRSQPVSDDLSLRKNARTLEVLQIVWLDAVRVEVHDAVPDLVHSTHVLHHRRPVAAEAEPVPLPGTLQQIHVVTERHAVDRVQLARQVGAAVSGSSSGVNRDAIRPRT